MAYPGTIYPPVYPGRFILEPTRLPSIITNEAPELPGWRYIITRLNGDGTETRLSTTTPIQGLSFRDDLSGPGELSGTITPEIPGTEGFFVPRSTAIYAEESGVIRFGAILNKVTRTGPDMALECIGFTGMITGEPYKGVRSVVDADPADEFRHIWDHYQSQEGKNLGLVWDDTTTNMLVGEPEDPALTKARAKAKEAKAAYDDNKTTANKKAYDDAKQAVVDGLNDWAAEPYKLNWFSTDDIGAEADALAEAFDYRVVHAWDGETITHRGIIGAPTLGARRDVRIRVGENIFTPLEIVDDAEAYASEVIVLGAGDGRDRLRASAQRATDRIGRTVTITDESLDTKAACKRRATQELRRLWGEVDVSSIELVNHPHAPIGTVNVGDQIRVVSDDADLWVRVLSMPTNTVSDRVTLDVARVERT